MTDIHLVVDYGWESSNVIAAYDNKNAATIHTAWLRKERAEESYDRWEAVSLPLLSVFHGD